MAGCSGEDEDLCSCVTPDQAARGISEEAIIRLQEAGICLGRLHRLCLKEKALPFDVQLQYLQKSLTEITDLVHVLQTMVDDPDN